MDSKKINPENQMLINGFSSVKQAISGHHPLESVVHHKDQMVDQANFAMLKTTQGIHAPLRLMMERKAACQVGRLPFLPSSNLMKDVLEGKDDVIGFEDILNDPQQPETMGPPHLVVEKQLGIL